MTYAEFKEGFLPEFLNLKSFAAKIRYANERLNKIGSGTGRIVYDIDGEKVLKLAKNAKGIAQNGAEGGAGYYRDTQHIVTEVFDSAEDDSWLISEKAKKVNEKRIKELTGIPSLNALFYFLRNYEEQSKGKREIFHQEKEESEFFWENEFASDLGSFIANYGQNAGDMGRPSTYGEVLRDGQPTIVLTDYGLNDEVYNTHYDPIRKQQYKMYELFNYADGNDDILSDTGDQGDIRRGMWAQMPYSVSDGPGVINEEFINFVSNRQEYPDKPIENLPLLTDRFHECVNNISEIMKVVEDKPRFYSNLLELQTYLTEQGFYNRDPLLRETFHINEDTPPVEYDTLSDRTYGDKLAKEIVGKLGLSTPKFLGGEGNGFAYEINNNLVMKLTIDISEADAASKLMRGQPKNISTIFNLYKVLDTDTNKSIFVIMQENINDKPLEKLRKLQSDINKIVPSGLDYEDIMIEIKKPAGFNHDEWVEWAKHVLTDNPEAGVSKIDREAAYEYIVTMFDIRQELLDFGIKSTDYIAIANLGYKDGVLKFFDVGGYYGIGEPDIPDEDMINLPEDGSAKFTTDNAVNQDDFPVYNTNDTSPSINNDLDANIAMYEDLVYNHVVGNATQDKYMLTEKRKKAWMPGSKTVKVKRKCQLAGLGNTSVACNQGDINNLEFGSVNETITLDLPAGDIQGGFASYKIMNDGQVVGEMELMTRGNRYLVLDKIFIEKEFRGAGYANDAMRLLFEYADKNKKIITLTPDNVWGASKGKLLKWYQSLGFVLNKGRNKDFETMQLMYRLPKGLVIQEYFSSLVPDMNEEIMSIQDLPFRDEVEKLGGEIYAVGGAVRDEYLGKDSKDLDIIIRGIPEEKLAQILKKYGVAKPVGNSFAVTKFIPNGETDEIDIALPRTEVSTGEGHNDFEITADYRLPIEKDLERRDFTINAIAKDMDGNVIDPFNGVADLKAGKIKITHPKSFVDDALRMLRAVQFASRFNFTIDPATYKLIRDNADKIKTVDKERIQIEFDKIVNKGDAQKGAFLLKDTGMLRAMGVDGPQLVSNDWNNVQTLAEFVYLLSHYNVSPVEFYKNNFRGDIDIINELEGLVIGMPVESNEPMVNRTTAHNMVVKSKGTKVLESKILPEKLQVAAQELLQGKYPKTVKELAVNGNDLIAADVPDVERGKVLKSLLMKIYNDDVRNTREELLPLVNQNPEEVEEGHLNYSDIQPSTWKVNGQEVTIDFFVQEYNKWNNQGGKPGYPDTSHESVLEFLQNNYEDFSVDDKLKRELYWELTDRDLLTEEPVKKVSYSAVVLDNGSYTKLIQVFTPMIPEGWEIIAHHMTIKMGSLADGSQEKRDLKSGKPIELNVIDYAIDGLVMAVGVEGYPSTNAKPHITIAVNRNAGGKPFLSNKLTDWKPLGFSLTLTGRVSEEE